MVAALLPRSRLCQLMGDSQQAVNSESATSQVCLHYMHSQEPEQTQQLNFSHNTLKGLCAGTAVTLEEPLCSSVLGGGTLWVTGPKNIQRGKEESADRFIFLWI